MKQITSTPFRRSRNLRALSGLLVLAISISVTIPCPVHAFPFFRNHKQVKKLDPMIMELTEKVGHEPELMCVEYLHYYFGQPDYGSAPVSGGSSYQWYGPAPGQVKYELQQDADGVGQITHALLKMHTTDSALDFQKLQAQFKNEGVTPKAFFNQQLFPTQQISFVPYTAVSFAQPQNSFEVQEIDIEYNGPGLEKPARNELVLASEHRRAQALELVGQGKYSQAILMLIAHLSENPGDMEAHFALGQAYRANGRLNEAIHEYQIAYANSASNADLQQKCSQELIAMNVMAPSGQAPAPSSHQYEIYQNGQRIREKNGNADGQAQNDNQTPFTIQPLDAPQLNTPQTSGLNTPNL